MKYLFILFAIVLLAGCKKKDTAPIPNDYTVSIPFDGNAIESVSGTNGTISGATYTNDHHGNANKAMAFNPVDSATVDFGDLVSASFDSTNLFTISCWVKVADTSSFIAILSKRGYTGPFEYSIDNHFNHTGFTTDNWIASGQTSVYGTDPLKAYVAIQPGLWQHIAYVADGSALKVYVNGVLQSGTDLYDAGMSFSHTTGHLVIGNGGGYGRNYYFNGSVDDIKIYKRALAVSEVQYLATQ